MTKLSPTVPAFQPHPPRLWTPQLSFVLHLTPLDLPCNPVRGMTLASTEPALLRAPKVCAFLYMLLHLIQPPALA